MSSAGNKDSVFNCFYRFLLFFLRPHLRCDKDKHINIVVR